MSSQQNLYAQFAICLHNEGYPAALERFKIYQIIPDVQAEQYEQVRIIDESGEDYLYPAEYFVRLELPEVVEKAFLQAA